MEATDGQEAWKILEQTPIDLLVTDLCMPRLSGIELCAKARQNARLAELPVVIITAMAPGLSIEESQSLGIARCIPKPFSPQQLVAVVRELLAVPAAQPGAGSAHTA